MQAWLEVDSRSGKPRVARSLPSRPVGLKTPDEPDGWPSAGKWPLTVSSGVMPKRSCATRRRKSSGRKRPSRHNRFADCQELRLLRSTSRRLSRRSFPSRRYGARSASAL